MIFLGGNYRMKRWILLSNTRYKELKDSYWFSKKEFHEQLEVV